MKGGYQVKSSFSGFLGIAYLLGKIGDAYRDQVAEYLGTTVNVGPSHITLYQGRLRDVPAEQVESALADADMLSGAEVRLGQVALYGSRYIFWDVYRVPGQCDIWQATQQLAASHLIPYLDPDQPALRQKMVISEPCLGNIRKTGYALFGTEIRPHVTVAVVESGQACHLDLPAVVWAAIWLQGPSLVRLGANGSVEEVLVP